VVQTLPCRCRRGASGLIHDSTWNGAPAAGADCECMNLKLSPLLARKRMLAQFDHRVGVDLAPYPRQPIGLRQIKQRLDMLGQRKQRGAAIGLGASPTAPQASGW